MADGLLVSLAKALVQRAKPPEYSNGPSYAGVIYSENRAAKTNVDLYRAWARTPWIRGAINIRKDQIASADFEIVPFENDRPHSKRLAKDIKFLFDHPNKRDRSFRAFITPVMDDLMTLDAGCIEGIETLGKQLRYIYPVDAKYVRVARDWDGLGGENEPRYFWYPDGFYHGVSWQNRQFTYLKTNATTYAPLGISPIEILKMTIDAELSAADYNRRQVKGAAPEGLLHLGEGVPPDKVAQFQADWQVFQQTGGAMAIIGGGKNPSYSSFRASNRDMQFLEWVRYLVTQIAVVYGESIQDLQQMFDINRSTGDVQTENSEDRGLRPLADLLQDELTQQIVWHPSFGGPDNNLAFRFTKLKIRESYERARTHEISLGRMPKMTVNEARVEDGREPMGSLTDKDNPFNQLLAQTSQGLVRIPDSIDALPTPAELMGAKAGPEAQPPDSNVPKSTTGQPRAASPAPVRQGSAEEKN